MILKKSSVNCSLVILKFARYRHLAINQETQSLINAAAVSAVPAVVNAVSAAAAVAVFVLFAVSLAHDAVFKV